MASPASSDFRNFLIDVRIVERWPALSTRRFSFCRARLRACGEFATDSLWFFSRKNEGATIQKMSLRVKPETD